MNKGTHQEQIIALWGFSGSEKLAAETDRVKPPPPGTAWTTVLGLPEKHVTSSHKRNSVQEMSMQQPW